MRGLAYLERYPVVHSRDSEFARDKLYSAYGATGFEARNDGFGIRANFAQLTSIGLAFCSYNSAVSLSFPEADFVRQFFSIQGDAKFSTANRSEPIGAWSPFVSAESRLRLDFEAGYRQLVVRVDAKALERSLKSLLGDASDRKLTFSGDALIRGRCRSFARVFFSWPRIWKHLVQNVRPCFWPSWSEA